MEKGGEVDVWLGCRLSRGNGFKTLQNLVEVEQQEEQVKRRVVMDVQLT